MKKLDAILAEAPDFPMYVVQCMTVEALEAIFNFYITGITPEQVKRLAELNPPPRQEPK